MRKKKLPDSVGLRMARYMDNQKKRGMSRVSVWVPAEKKEAVLEYAKHLRGDIK